MIFSLLKHTFLIVTLFFTSSDEVIAFSNINMVEPPSLAETFYDKLEVKENLPILTNQYINKKVAKRTNVPAALWSNVKNNIDYASFKARVILIIPNYYSNSELEQLINLHLDRPHIPITKSEFKKELYLLIAEFGKEDVLADINTMLIDNGYETFPENEN